MLQGRCTQEPWARKTPRPASGTGYREKDLNPKGLMCQSMPCWIALKMAIFFLDAAMQILFPFISLFGHKLRTEGRDRLVS